MIGEREPVYVFINQFIRIIGALRSMSGIVWISSRRYCLSKSIRTTV